MGECLDPICVQIGHNLRRARWAHSQLDTLQKLSAEIGITWQQLQKYEKGKNRLSLDMAIKLARVLDVPLLMFCEGVLKPAEVYIEPSIEEMELLQSYRLLHATTQRRLRDSAEQLTRVRQTTHAA